MRSRPASSGPTVDLPAPGGPTKTAAGLAALSGMDPLFAAPLI